MFRIFICLSMLILTSCASTIPTLSTEVLNELRQSRITIVFTDTSKQINYTIEIYEVLNITQRKVSSSYREDWESEEYITNIHTLEFAKNGFKIRMFSEIFSKSDLNKVRQMHQQIIKDNNIEPKIKPILTPEVKELLRERGIEHLVLIDWTGFTLFIQSRGLPAQGMTTTNFKIFNVKSGNVLWQSSSSADITIDLNKMDGRIFLESNELENLKLEVKRLLLSQYNRKENNIWHLFGLNNNPNQ